MIAPSRAADMVMYRRRTRSLWGSISALLVQPAAFYEAFPAARQWLLIAALLLIVTGFSAIHQPAAASVDATAGAVAQEGAPAPINPEAGPGDLFIPPNDVSGGGGGAAAAAAPDVSKTVMTALLAAGGLLLAWFVQALVLCEVSLINGTRPRFGLNLQIAIWASVPLGLMLVIQQVYFAIGGKAGMLGLSLLLQRWPGFATLPEFSQSVLVVIAVNFTLFALWNLALLYLGGRHVLKGKRVAVLLVIVIWVILATFVPALTTPGGVRLPAPSAAASIDAAAVSAPPVQELPSDEAGGAALSSRPIIIQGGG